MASPDDLLVRSRRAPLMQQERAQLDFELANSPQLRLARALGEGLAEEGRIQPGDARAHLALVDTIVRRHAATSPATSTGWRRLRARWLGVLGVPLLTAAAAAATASVYHRVLSLSERSEAPAMLARSIPGPNPHPPALDSTAPAPGAVAPDGYLAPAMPPPRRVAAPSGPAKTTPERAPAPRKSAAVEIASPQSPSPLRSPSPARPIRAEQRLPRARAKRRAAPRARIGSSGLELDAPTVATAVPAESLVQSRPASAELGPSASELLIAAQRARQSSWRQAVPLYQQLIQKFPRALEAGIAELALAKHALARGMNGEALAWFRRYQMHPANPLLVEAYWGEVEALERLRRPTQLRRALRALVQQFPETAYGQIALRRLREMDP